MRVVIETECEHGWAKGSGHWVKPPKFNKMSQAWSKEVWCPGGSRRVISEGEYLLIEKVDGEWPERVHGVGLGLGMAKALDTLSSRQADHTNYNTGEPCFCVTYPLSGICLDEEPVVGMTDPVNGTA